MDYSFSYKCIEWNSGGVHTASEEFVDANVPATLGDILAGAMARGTALTTLAFLFTA